MLSIKPPLLKHSPHRMRIHSCSRWKSKHHVALTRDTIQNIHHKKSVSFGMIRIREYEMALGDHLACHRGPPLTIGAKFVEQESIQLESYEQQRRGKRRSRVELKMDPCYRRELLIFHYGYPEEVIVAKEMELANERRIRRHTQMKMEPKKIVGKRKVTSELHSKPQRRRLSLKRRHSTSR